MPQEVCVFVCVERIGLEIGCWLSEEAYATQGGRRLWQGKLSFVSVLWCSLLIALACLRQLAQQARHQALTLVHG